MLSDTTHGFNDQSLINKKYYIILEIKYTVRTQQIP